MNEPIKVDIRTDVERIADLERRMERLEGMQGPEQGLVGESRSARKQGHAEEAQPGERGVGEIVELSKLLRHIDKDFEEARLGCEAAIEEKNGPLAAMLAGKMAGLSKSRMHAEDVAGKRSDLSNADVEARDL